MFKRLIIIFSLLMGLSFLFFSQVLPFTLNIPSGVYQTTKVYWSLAYADHHQEGMNKCAEINPDWFPTADCNGDCVGGVTHCGLIHADELPDGLQCWFCSTADLCKESEGKYIYDNCGNDCKEDEECKKESPDRLCFECLKKENPCFAEDGEFYSADCNGVCSYNEQCVPAEKEGCYWCVEQIVFASCQEEGLKEYCEKDETCKEVKVKDIICCDCIKKKIKRPTTGTSACPDGYQSGYCLSQCPFGSYCDSQPGPCWKCIDVEQTCLSAGKKVSCASDEHCKVVKVGDQSCCDCLKRPTTGDGGGRGGVLIPGGGTQAGTANEAQEDKCEENNFHSGPCPGWCTGLEEGCEARVVEGQTCHECVSTDPCWRLDYYSNPEECECPEEDCVQINIYDGPAEAEGCWECLEQCPEGYKVGYCPQECPEGEVCESNWRGMKPCHICRDAETVHAEHSCARVRAFSGGCPGHCDEDEDCEAVFLDDGTDCHRCHEQEGAFGGGGGTGTSGGGGRSVTVGGGGQGEEVETCSEGALGYEACQNACDPGICVQVDVIYVEGNPEYCWACQPAQEFCEGGFIDDDSCGGGCPAFTRCRRAGQMTDEDGNEHVCYKCKEINCAMYNRYDSCNPNPCTDPWPICKTYVLEPRWNITCAYCVPDVNVGGTAVCVGVGCDDGVEIDCSEKTGSIATHNRASGQYECICPPRTIDRGTHCEPETDSGDDGSQTGAVRSVGDALDVFNAHGGTLQGGSSRGGTGMDTSAGSGTETAVGVGGEGYQDYSGFEGQEDDQQQDEQEQVDEEQSDDQESDSQQEEPQSGGLMLTVPAGGGRPRIEPQSGVQQDVEPQSSSQPEVQQRILNVGSTQSFEQQNSSQQEVEPLQRNLQFERSIDQPAVEQQSSGQQEVEPQINRGLIFSVGPTVR